MLSSAPSSATSSAGLVRRAYERGLTVPAFNIPYLPMMEPVIRAVVDQDCFALAAVARLEWMKFGAVSPAAVHAEFTRRQRPDYVHLHLDHVPVIDEDHLRVDFLAVIRQAIDLGFGSVMVDGSRLGLDQNIEATRQAVELAHAAGIPCEAELGAVMGHEEGPLPPYEALYASGKGFTDPAEAARFVAETGCDWLSVAIGNVHGAISAAARGQKKVAARLNLEHLATLRQATGVPLVLHGGSSVQQDCVLSAIKEGIAKVNIGTEIRQSYEAALQASGDVAAAQQAVYDRTTWVLRDYFGLSGSRQKLIAD
jgi:fructose-bisphosphate aldolase class II